MITTLILLKPIINHLPHQYGAYCCQSLFAPIASTLFSVLHLECHVWYVAFLGTTVELLIARGTVEKPGWLICTLFDFHFKQTNIRYKVML